MAYVTMSKPTQGTATLKSQIDQLIDNDEALNDAVGVGSGVINGSFETGTGTDAPTGWTRTTWGTAAYDTTTPAHGAQAYKFSSTGAGGGTLLSEDFIECSALTPVVLSWLLKSSVADIKNIVTLKFYDKAQSAVSDTVLYSDDTTNPTSWTRFVRGCTPPATACYMKILLTFADSSDATSGDCYMDGVELLQSTYMYAEGTIAEQNEDTVQYPSYDDAGSVAIDLSTLTLSSASVIKLYFKGSLKRYTDSQLVYQRFRVGTDYSNENGTTSATYVEFDYEMTVHGFTGGTLTLYQQLAASATANGDATGKKNDAAVHFRVLVW